MNIHKIIYLTFFLAFAFAMQIQIARAVDADPDFVVSQVTLTPLAPVPGEKTIIAYRIVNNGGYLYSGRGIDNVSVEADGFEMIGTPRLGTFLRIDQNTPLRTGAYFDIIVEGVFAEKGYHFVTFTFDPTTQVYERNKENNKFTHFVPVGVPNLSFGAKVDLAIDDIFTKPIANVHSYEPIKLIVRVRNDGAPMPFSTPFMFIDKYFPSFIETSASPTFSRSLPTLSNPLEGSEYIDFIYDGYFSKSGAHELYFTINGQELLYPERTRDDNFMKKTLQILDGDFIERPTGSIIVKEDQSSVYRIEDGVARIVADQNSAREYEKTADTVGELEFSKYSVSSDYTPLTQKQKNGTIVKGFYTPTVYRIENGMKRPFVSERAFLSLGYDWYDIVTLPPESLDVYTEGLTIYPAELPNGSLVKTKGRSSVYYIDGGIKHAIASAQAFTNRRFDWKKVITTSEEELVKYADGEMIY